MIIFTLILLGLIFGSFTNALTWRTHEQDERVKKQSKMGKGKNQSLKANKKSINILKSDPLSMIYGRSMCSNCHHELAAVDLVPLFSWLSLRGKCRYCKVKIQDSPLVEVALPAIFVLTYLFWPETLHSASHITVFVLWLMEVVGLVALAVYDLRWMLLPNRLLYPLVPLALAQSIILVCQGQSKPYMILQLFLAVAIAGGLFYLLFQLSQGKWIGGGDVKLGWLLGITAATASQSVLIIFFASIGGTLLAAPLLISGKLKTKSIIPFGPLLIAAALIVRLFGVAVWAWYQREVGGGF